MAQPHPTAGLFVVAPDPTDEPAAIVDWLRETGYGGLFLQWRHLTDRDWLFELTERIRSAGDDELRPLITVDEEGGLVSDVAALTTTGPSPAALGAIDDPTLTFRVALAMGDKLRSMGFNLLFAPSLDINSEPLNPVIGTRAFGSTPAQVIRHGLPALEGYARAGLVTCVKHFPGHGATKLDSHHALPTLDVSPEILRQRELAPFHAAVDGGVQAVMTAHVAVPNVDPGGAPATLSPILLSGLLRDELDFDGVVFSDDLEMAGVAALGDPGTIVRRALMAGVDSFLFARNRELAAEAARAFARGTDSGDIPEERVAAALLRFERLRRGIQAAETAIDEASREAILDIEHEELLTEAAARSIMLLPGRAPELPVPWDSHRGLMVLPANSEPRLNPDVDFLRDLVEPLDIELIVTSLDPSDSEREGVLQRAARADYLVACTMTRGRMPAGQRRLIDALMPLKKPLILVSLLDPHDLDDFPSARTRLATRGFGPLTLAALIDVLAGRSEPAREPAR